MKKILVLFIVSICSLAGIAQNDVTKFLGIPVDGSKQEMIEKLKAKGFRPSTIDKEILLEGEFNGTEVLIHVVTNGNKVYRIAVSDANPQDETNIKIRFNKLCSQFENNPKYIALDNFRISDEEDIAYEMHVNKKRYEATYYQVSKELNDSATIMQQLAPMFLGKFTPEQLENPTDSIRQEMIKIVTQYVMDNMRKRLVWFVISEFYGKYYISMYYDNEYNHANGEDL